ncbi:hypothetical protein [Actinoplanes sp. NPDC049681]|uniref:hypothetical protein n=1 Tax=Actinoplanes sp. NPDC049681 TaxID=3363905 RepID=UPI0037A370E8
MSAQRVRSFPPSNAGSGRGRKVLGALDRALAEIDAEPGDDTITLADELIADLQRPGRRTDIETTSGSS